jgi:hypothetical protein
METKNGVIKMVTVNELLRDLAQAVLDEQVEILYNEMVDELTAEFEMQEYAARSYDADAVSYGLQ